MVAERTEEEFDDDVDAEIDDDDLDALLPPIDDLDDRDFWEYNDGCSEESRQY